METKTMTEMCLLIVGIVAAAILIIVVRQQLRLRQQAMLMREAIRNRDFSFRIPLSNRAMVGDREMQKVLNELGMEVNQLMKKNEVESWERLTRVLTHEIMNSIAPISSISQAYLSMPQTQESPYAEGIKAIYETSKGLEAFVDSYRKLTQLQRPQKENVNLRKAVEGVSQLFGTVKWEIDIDRRTMITTDPNLLRQTLINLAKNAVEAGATTISTRWDGTLKISNDGDPIRPEVRDDIFVPFFSTKSLGSGIGLSLSRQLMVSQGHDLEMADRPEGGYRVTFVIRI